MTTGLRLIGLVTICSLVAACQREEAIVEAVEQYQAIEETFGDRIDLANLANYANQDVPNHIPPPQIGDTPLTDAGATLGRVLFYDRNLSVDNSISCSSCHSQEHAFGDLAQASVGVNGQTGRHSMRLVNVRFAQETRFFWDERAPTLEAQTTQPIQDHIEMGFSGQDGSPDLENLLEKLRNIPYYTPLFTAAFGNSRITEERLQSALAQFISSIQSFDTPYDEGRRQTGNNEGPFPNFTDQENEGLRLFSQNPQLDNTGRRIGGGLGCNRCHRAPNFDIVPNSRNNGIIGTIDGAGTDLLVTRSPSLRESVKTDGSSNGPFFHVGISNDFNAVLRHYNRVPLNPQLDRRLSANGQPIDLAMTPAEMDAVFAFIKTLTGTRLYTDPKWSDPFLEEGIR